METAQRAALVGALVQVPVYAMLDYRVACVFAIQATHYALLPLVPPPYHPKARWAEWTLSSSLMVYILATTVNLAPAPLATLQATLILLGALAEHNQLLTLHITAWTLHATLWHTLWNNRAYAPDYMLVPAMMTLFSLFGALQAFAMATQLQQDLLELAYCILSFITKASMAWILLADQL
jgi:hypothetical protein